MKLIVAVDSEWGIGYRGDLLARVRGDLLNFRDVTKGKVVVYGSNTLATFPRGAVLKDRTNIVLHPDPDYKPEGAVVAHSLPELFEILKRFDTNDVFAIGGASVYRQLLPYCDTAYVTKFKKSYPKDVWFENLDENPEWALVSESAPRQSDPESDTDPALEYTFCLYKRVHEHTFLREATAEDVPGIYRLLTVNADHHRAIRPDLMGDKQSKFTPAEVENLVAGAETCVFVAESGGRLAGYIMFTATGDTAYVEDICVDPAFRRLGVGKSLMRAVESNAKDKGCAYLLLNVWWGNDGAIDFYRALGMSERSLRLDKKLD